MALCVPCPCNFRYRPGSGPSGANAANKWTRRPCQVISLTSVISFHSGLKTRMELEWLSGRLAIIRGFAAVWMPLPSWPCLASLRAREVRVKGPIIPAGPCLCWYCIAQSITPRDTCYDRWRWWTVHSNGAATGVATRQQEATSVQLGRL